MIAPEVIAASNSYSDAHRYYRIMKVAGKDELTAIRQDAVHILKECAFVEVNAPLAWTCVFSDISEVDVDRIFEISRRVFGDRFREPLDWSKEEENNARFRKWCALRQYGVMLECRVESENISESDVEFLSALKVLNCGFEESRCYLNAHGASFEILSQQHPELFCVEKPVLQENMGPSERQKKWNEYYHDCWKLRRKQQRAMADPESLFHVFDEYIDFLCAAGNEAQRYASYARGFVGEQYVKELRRAQYSDEEKEQIAQGWAAIFFLKGRGGIDFAPFYKSRKSIFGACIDGMNCPV